MKFITIGAYGFTESSFFKALQEAGVDTFCDLRWRRGVRGAEYTFANRARLEKRLAELGIRYLHFPDLAPDPALRQRQYEADQATGTGKRKRTGLSEAFIAGYRESKLSSFDSRAFVEAFGPETRTAALFCVEGEPNACHRSLLAERLQQDLGSEVTITHLRPNLTDKGV
jgi:uncharacterized protein (DUF488 family)